MSESILMRDIIRERRVELGLSQVETRSFARRGERRIHLHGRSRKTALRC